MPTWCDKINLFNSLGLIRIRIQPDGSIPLAGKAIHSIVPSATRFLLFRNTEVHLWIAALKYIFNSTGLFNATNIDIVIILRCALDRPGRDHTSPGIGTDESLKSLH